MNIHTYIHTYTHTYMYELVIKWPHKMNMNKFKKGNVKTQSNIVSFMLEIMALSSSVSQEL